jgi:excisionase family DNA binding protein
MGQHQIEDRERYECLCRLSFNTLNSLVKLLIVYRNTAHAHSEKFSNMPSSRGLGRYVTSQAMSHSESKSQLVDAPDSQMYTVGEASRLLHVCPSLIYTLCSRGKIEHHRHGLGRGTIRISKGAILQYLNYSKVTPTYPRRHSKSRFSQLDSDRLASSWRQQGVL